MSAPHEGQTIGLFSKESIDLLNIDKSENFNEFNLQNNEITLIIIVLVLTAYAVALFMERVRTLDGRCSFLFLYLQVRVYYIKVNKKSAS